MPPEPTRAKLKRKATRKEDESAYRFDGGHSREIEQKRNAGQISCAECRRLKIKCDKQIPCQSCQRRGCAALCPNGSLATGQGTRFVLAATEHFHRRITKMSDRIRQLEDALASLQSQHSSEPHPLLRDDLLGVNQRDDDATLALGGEGQLEAFVQPADIIDSFGTLSITDRGVSRFFGPTGGTEALLMSDSPHSESTSPAHTPESCTGLGSGGDRRGSSVGSGESQPVNKMFSVAFPFTPVGPRATVQELIESHIPPWEKADHLLQLYFKNAAWLFHDVSREQVMEELVPAFYEPGPKEDSSSGNVQLSQENQDRRSPHALSLIFLLFAIGALVDLECPTISPEAEHFHQIARAALCIQPVLEKPSLVTIQALHLLSVYNAMSGNELVGEDTSNETTWSLITLAAHLSQTIGLHRDSARWDLPPDIVQRRRTLFWDLFIADSWHSLNTGRPPTFSLAYIDCRFPTSAIKSEEGESLLPPREFDSWGYRFACECVAEVAARTLTAEAPSYSTIMELDRKVREFPVPLPAEALVAQVNATSPAMVPEEKPLSIAESMGLFAMAHSREVILLYIHRSFFAQAIIENPVNPLKSAYAPSFLAAYRASTTTLHTVQAQYRQHPILTARFWVIWSFAFSSAIVFGTIVTRGPKSPLAANALKELDDACVLFANAAPQCMRAARALPILTKLSEKAHHAMNMAQTGQVSSMEYGQHWNMEEAENNDELAIFAGRTRFVSTKRRSVSAEPQPPLNNQPYSSSSLSNTASAMEQPQPQQYRHTEFLAPPPLADPSRPSGSWAAQEQSSRYTHDQAHHQDYPGSMLLPPHPSQQQQASYQQAQPSLRQSTYSFPANERISHPQPPQVPQLPQLSLSTRELPLPHGQPHAHPHAHASQARPHTHHQNPPPPQPSSLAGPSEMSYRSQQHDLASHRYPQHHQPLAAHAHSSYHPASDSHGMYDRSRAQYDHSPAPSAHSVHSMHGHHGHGHGHAAASQHASGSTSGMSAPPDLVGLGMASQESRLDERWTSFMRDEGYFDGYNYRGR